MSHGNQSNALLNLVVEDELLVAMELESHLREFGYGVLGSVPSIETANASFDGTRPMRLYQTSTYEA